MVTKFRTQTGSIYVLNRQKMTWERRYESENSGGIRQTSGELTHWPEIKVGQSVILADKSVLPGFSYHAVYTSNVVEIHEGFPEGSEL